ncbi:metal ABC transporter solute-binding protein, Zn/Mn family [Bifidobacterium vespertilionis]|uniref:ABC transporter substrate-binding protein n=1 Tax=Bifidobacterium vespertilionis TaxID=2562524 RepID=A0A5J5E325_9BIFI|nr:zinc ABC transporter substrate-binding protein [Bifidobacterium vespertilionis]KAA8822032.1 ABC transporter substrate-binding protein [Bifidobacterium vespertilionis]KAA8823527.1 ABC transporter substrate-binding protein [Bifidobacterium vespertilionis]
MSIASIMSATKRIAAAAIAAGTLFAVAACGSAEAGQSGSQAAAEGGASSQPAKIEVVASINQWGSVAKDLGGDLVDVTEIMTNTNVEAHDYEPTSQDVAKFTGAKVVVVNGADYDPWASKAASSAKATVVDAAETAGVKEGDNPHVWFSAKAREATADAITKAYIAAEPANQAKFEELNKAWKDRETKLESKIKDASAKLSGQPYAATESVAWYLADDLGMTDATPSGYAQASANESEPSPSDLKQYTDTLAGGSIKLLVFNTQEADATTDQITNAAKSANVPIVELTEQMPSQYDDLLDWMDALVDQFAAAVK